MIGPKMTRKERAEVSAITAELAKLSHQGWPAGSYEELESRLREITDAAIARGEWSR